jgi:hypothetical protein
MNQNFTRGDPSVAAQRDDRPRHLQSAQCSLCGIALPIGLMMADGGRACADIRWYCQDAKSCTERWTARLPRTGHVAQTPYPGELRPGPDPLPTELLGVPEEA